MDEVKEEKEFEKREKKLEEKVKEWIKDPYKATLIGILIFALIIRIYYFFLTKDQALWWDSLCYGLIAKNLVNPIWTDTIIYVGETSIRPWLFSILWAGLLKVGLEELASKFLLEFVPSVLTVYFTYLVAEKMYNKRVALIASFILAISWLHLFYSMRMMTHILGLFLSMASAYFFFRSLEGEKLHFKFFTLSVFLAFLALLTRWTYGLVGIIYIVHILFIKRNILKDRNFWVGGLIGSIPLFVFFALSYLKYGVLFSALTRYSENAAKTEYAYYAFGFFSHILPQPFFSLFLIGIAVMLVQVFLGFGLIAKVKKLGSHIFVLSLLALNTAFLIFYIGYVEDRYFFECFISILFITAYGLDTIYLYLKKYHKQLALVFVIVLLASGAYVQYTHGNPIITSRISSFYQMKTAFLWIKDNTEQDARIFGWGHSPYVIYYSERYPVRVEEVQEGAEFDYAVLHSFVPQPPEFTDHLESIKENLTVVHAEYFSPESPAVIIYKYNK